MGIHADTVEKIREQLDLDISLGFGFQAYSKVSVSKLLYEYNQRKQDLLEQKNSRTTNVYRENGQNGGQYIAANTKSKIELEHQYACLMNLKQRYTLQEKMLFHTLNNTECESELANEALRIFQDQLRRDIGQICEYLKEISNALNYYPDVCYIQFDEIKEMQNIAQIIIYSIYHSLKAETEIDSSEFRLTIRDCGILLSTLDNEKKSSKMQNDRVLEYFAKHFGVKKSVNFCKNCGHFLYEPLSSCFVCYERN